MYMYMIKSGRPEQVRQWQTAVSSSSCTCTCIITLYILPFLMHMVSTNMYGIGLGELACLRMATEQGEGALNSLSLFARYDVSFVVYPYLALYRETWYMYLDQDTVGPPHCAICGCGLSCTVLYVHVYVRAGISIMLGCYVPWFWFLHTADYIETHMEIEPSTRVHVAYK